jgi:hypothetical protein
MVRSEGNMSLKIPVTLPGIDPGIVRLVAQRLNHYGTPGPLQFSEIDKEMLGNIMKKKSWNVFSKAYFPKWSVFYVQSI